jgi:hypothetical protein
MLLLIQASSPAHHQHPMMVPSGVFHHGYIQLQPLVQHQLIMGHVTSVQEQHQQPAYPPVLQNDVLHHPGGWCAVNMAGQQYPQRNPLQAYMNPPLYQHMGVDHPFPVQEYACSKKFLLRTMPCLMVPMLLVHLYLQQHMPGLVFSNK